MTSNYRVAISSDGCTNWLVDNPAAIGTEEQCLEFIGKHLPPKGCEFELLAPDGRARSFMYERAARRYRLQWQDLKGI